jgi:hypothetical protein
MAPPFPIEPWPLMGYGFTALNSARMTPMNHEKDRIHFVWKTNRAASVICKSAAMKKNSHPAWQNWKFNLCGNRTATASFREKMRHESFCSTLEPIWWRFPAEWYVHIVYVIHHDAGNSDKMANGKENRKRPDDCVKITQKGVWHPIKLPHE